MIAPHANPHSTINTIPSASPHHVVATQVTLAEAVPVAGSGIALPLDLTKIAAQCNGAYFAPKRFAAVQLAYTNPRCRILVFRKSMQPSNPHTLGARM